MDEGAGGLPVLRGPGEAAGPDRALAEGYAYAVARRVRARVCHEACGSDRLHRDA